MLRPAHRYLGRSIISASRQRSQPLKAYPTIQSLAKSFSTTSRALGTMSPLVAQNSKPRVILGLMTFGPDEDAGARVTSLDDYKAVLDHFQSRGYNEIDTARVYVAGKQEAFTREAGYKDRGFAIATKCYPHEKGQHKPERLRQTLETSLKELGTDNVDIFYLHAADRSVPFVETLEECNKMHKEGKFNILGLSNYTSFEVAEIATMCRAKGWVRPTLYQGMYNAITRNIEAELFPACRRHGLDIVIYNPIAGGLFSGKYSVKDQPESGRFSDKSGVIGSRYRERYFRDTNFQALEIIEPVVKKHNLTMVETAFRWVLHHSKLNIRGPKGGEGNDGVILGVSSLQQLEQNLEHFDKGPLPEEVVKALDQAWQVSQPGSAPYWHGAVEYSAENLKGLRSSF